MTTPQPAKTVPSWTTPEFYTHLLLLLLLAGGVVLSFVFAGHRHVPGWAPILVTPLAAVLAVVAQGLYLLHVNGLKKGFPLVEAMVGSDMSTFGPALLTIAKYIPGLVPRLDASKSSADQLFSALTNPTATVAAPAPAPAASSGVTPTPPVFDQETAAVHPSVGQSPSPKG